MISLAVKCLSTTSGSGLTSSVSNFMMSPGLLATYPLGFLIAYGRCLHLFLADMWFGMGSLNTSRYFSRCSIRPPVELGQSDPLRRGSITNLSFSYLGG